MVTVITLVKTRLNLGPPSSFRAKILSGTFERNSVNFHLAIDTYCLFTVLNWKHNLLGGKLYHIMKEKKKRSRFFFTMWCVWKRGGFVPQTNKKFRTLNVGGGVTILVPLSNFSTEKVLFCTHFTNWFKSFLCFWRGFFC